MITDKEYLEAIKTKVRYEKEQVSRKFIFLFPSHAHLTKKALDIYGNDESDINMAKHRAFIEGGCWMLDECIKVADGN